MYVVLLVTVSVLLSLSDVAEPCPAGCRCQENHVNCRNLSLAALPGGIYKKTDWLIMCDNNLETLRNDTFDQLIHLRNLDVSKNRISSVETAAFHLLNDLMYLYLPYNNISILNPDIFPGSLKYLSLSWNPLLIPQDTPFLNIPGLERLLLSHCNLNHLPSSIFAGTPNLTYLNIGNNLLENLNVETFRVLSKLKVLRLSGNRLTVIDPDIFKHKTQLYEISLSSNNISRIDFSVFKELPKLATLYMSGNPLSDDPQAYHLSNLTDLKLRSCGLTQMPVSMLRAAPNLESLTLAKNTIQHIDVAILNGLEHLRFVDLSKNPMACDCRYQQLWDWTMQRRVIVRGVCLQKLRNCSLGQNTVGR